MVAVNPRLSEHRLSHISLRMSLSQFVISFRPSVIVSGFFARVGPPLVQPNPHPRTGEVKPPYRAERLPQQGRTLIRPGKAPCSFNPAPRYGVDAPPYSSIRNFLHTRVQNFVRVKYMIIPYILCCSPVLTDLAHAYAKFVFQYVTGCVGGM